MDINSALSQVVEAFPCFCILIFVPLRAVIGFSTPGRHKGY